MSEEYQASTSNSNICNECFLLISDMDKHMFIDHGVAISVEAEQRLKDIAALDAKRATKHAAIDMEYMGDGPTQPK